jgi:hypothetical protein
MMGISIFKKTKMQYNSILNSYHAQELIREIRSIVANAHRSADQVILDETEFCEKLHISKRHAADLRREGKIKYSKDGGKIYYKLSWVLEYIDRYSIAPPISLVNDIRHMCKSY